MHVLVGIVGYCAFVRGYPLGPELMRRLQALPGSCDEVEIREMNWGPVAIVQDFQARSRPPDRVVLIGALDQGLPPGSVRCRRWAGADLGLDAVQGRMFEAVTGVIRLDNLLVIGSHFGIWPAATFAVGLQWPDSGLGDLVLDEAEAGRAGQVVGEQPLSADNERTVCRLVQAVQRLVLDDHPAGVPVLTASELAPVAAVSQHRFVAAAGQPHPS